MQHVNCVGTPGNEVLDELVDAAGVEPAPVQIVEEQVALEHQRLVLEGDLFLCLLYTSPSPRD